MKNLLFLLCFISSFAFGQQTNNVPWYKFVNKLTVGKFQLQSSGLNTTSFTIGSNQASVYLGTVASDQIVTFPALSATLDSSVMMVVMNLNSSGFAWNVIGTVIEANGDPVTTIPKGMNIFMFVNNTWHRYSSGSGGGGSGDTLRFAPPLYVVDDSVYLDQSGMIRDTFFVALHGTSLYSVLYPVYGTRDSLYCCEIPGGGGSSDNIYNKSDTLTSNRVVEQDGKSLLFQNLAGNGPHIFATGLGFEVQTNGSDPVIAGWVDAAATSTAVETFSMKRTSSIGPVNGFGQYWTFKGNDGSFDWDMNKLKSTFTNIGGSAETRFTITGISGAVEQDWLTLVPNYQIVNNGADTLATLANARGIVGSNLIIQNVGTGQPTWYTSGDTLYNKRLKTTYALTASTASDSSLQYAIDTTLMATRLYAASVGGGGGSVAGSAGQVQYNVGGAFGASSNLVLDGTNRALTIGGAVNTGANLQVSNDNATLHATTTAAVAPATALFVAGNSHGSIISLKAGVTSTLRESHTFIGTRGTLASPTTVQSDDDLGGLSWGGYTGTAYVYGAILDGIVDGTVTSTNLPTAVHIFTTATTVAARQSRLKVANDGEVILAANARTFTDKGIYNLQVEGGVYIGGRKTIAVTTYTDANVASVVGVGMAILPTITANRTITIANGVVAGELLTIHNVNSAGFAWGITGTVQDAAGASITTFTNDTVYQLFWNGSAWVKMN